ncbi:MAG: hypothetical protein HY403_00620 [Elusimicrobia bacterium]|nr:hypothetical protein [Elusimicrobiota bacterium]
MGYPPPEDLSREIERLWARLGNASDPAAPASYSPPAAGAELAWETAAMLKAQQRRRVAALTEALETKEASLKHWRDRAEALQAEVDALRAQADGGAELVFAQLLDAQQRLEGAARALEHERAAHLEERRAMEAALDEAKARIAAEVARAREAEARFSRRETQNLIDLKDVQSSAERRQQEALQADQAVNALKGSLSEAKNALEKTLAELLLERQERVRVEEERARALKKTDEVERHFADLQKLWEEERAQWRELWDRERSTWETQRQELAQWEETLRREREAWHSELQEKERTHLTFTDSLAGKIRETTAAAEQVAQRMRQLESREERDRAVSAQSNVDSVRAAAARARRVRAAASALAAAAVLAAGSLAWRWGAQWRYSLEATAPVASLNPTALAFDGTLLWVADWGGRLSAHDPVDPRRAVREIGVPEGGVFRPTALAFGDGRMWTLDAARARLIRASAARPEAVLAAVRSPGPAPTALAFDGSSLWSYDSASRALYRHAGDEATYQAYPLEDDVVPNALAWVDGRLWLHDTKSRRLMIYALESGRFALKEAHPSPDAATAGFVVLPGKDGPLLWALVGPSAQRTQPALLRLKLRRRAPFAVF